MASAATGSARPPSLTFTATGSGYWNTQSGRVAGEAGLLDSVVDDESQAAGVNALWQVGGRTSVESRVYWTRFEETNAGTLVPTQVAQPADKLYESLVKGDASVSHVLGERHLLQGGAEISGNRYRGVNRVRDDDGHEVTTSVSLGAGPDQSGELAHADARRPLRLPLDVRLGVLAQGGVQRTSGRGGPRSRVLWRRVPRARSRATVLPFRAQREFLPGDRQSRRSIRSTRNRGRSARTTRTDRDGSASESMRFETTSTISSRPTPSASSRRRRSSRRCSRSKTSTPRSVLSSGASCLSTATWPTRGRKGIELDGEAALGGSFQLAGAYTYLDAFDQTRNQPLAGRHRHQGHTRLTWHRAPLGLRAEIRGTFYSSWIAVASVGGADPGVTRARLRVVGRIRLQTDCRRRRGVRCARQPHRQPGPQHRPFTAGRHAGADLSARHRSHHPFGVRWTFDKK